MSCGYKHGTIVNHPTKGLSVVMGGNKKENILDLYNLRTWRHGSQGRYRINIIKNHLKPFTRTAFRSEFVSGKLI